MMIDAQEVTYEIIEAYINRPRKGADLSNYFAVNTETWRILLLHFDRKDYQTLYLQLPLNIKVYHIPDPEDDS